MLRAGEAKCLSRFPYTVGDHSRPDEFLSEETYGKHDKKFPGHYMLYLSLGGRLEANPAHFIAAKPVTEVGKPLDECRGHLLAFP